MRTDVFDVYKSVHIKLDKEKFLELKKIAIDRGLNVQEMFAEFTRLIVEGNPTANRILDNYTLRKIKEKIEEKPRAPRNQPVRSNLDADALYALIDEDSGAE